MSFVDSSSSASVLINASTSLRRSGEYHPAHVSHQENLFGETLAFANAPYHGEIILWTQSFQEKIVRSVQIIKRT
uniref:AlNc14C222G9135 protein n=1 Tax=Albugo laibachii Nc14 TaxID=890382 RepID=F0WRZ2_9STRA|nr:AlNc14C222G9135 [Albugo laibachii Nc14]|eukprot:CCA24109.1 AlNc14C222G9135 [Albugo laibachii Nc14]